MDNSNWVTLNEDSETKKIWLLDKIGKMKQRAEGSKFAKGSYGMETRSNCVSLNINPSDPSNLELSMKLWKEFAMEEGVKCIITFGSKKCFTASFYGDIPTKNSWETNNQRARLYLYVGWLCFFILVVLGVYDLKELNYPLFFKTIGEYPPIY